MNRKLALGLVVAVALLVAVGLQAAGLKSVGSPKSQPLAPRAVNSWTIFDDGDATADTLYFPPASVASGYQDHWLVIQGGVVTASPVPFNIEQIRYYMENMWSTHATWGIWTAGNLSTRYAGGNPGGSPGWITVTLPTPLAIPAVGFPQWWMAAENSYQVGSPAACTTCRNVGVDTGSGLGGPGHGYYSDIDANGWEVLVPVAMPTNMIPIIRAGITATSNTVPVELVEFSVD